MVSCTPKQCKNNSGRESFFGRRGRAGGSAAPDRRYNSYFYILQAPEEYKNDLGISGCGGPPTICCYPKADISLLNERGRPVVERTHIHRACRSCVAVCASGEASVQSEEGSCALWTPNVHDGPLPTRHGAYPAHTKQQQPPWLLRALVCAFPPLLNVLSIDGHGRGYVLV